MADEYENRQERQRAAILIESDRSSVGEHLGCEAGEFRCVITHSDYRVGADLVSVLNHAVEGFHAGLLADMSPFLDVAAGYRLESADNPASDAGRANDNTANYAEVFGDLSPFDLKSRGDDHSW